VATPSQLADSANAPWTRTIVGFDAAIAFWFRRRAAIIAAPDKDLFM
jgi:hypothetical protein